MSYLVSGNNPAAIKTAERNIFTATAGQTTFTISQGYQPGDIDVFLNGVRLVDSDDYYATNGSTVVLTSGATVGDSLVVVCYRPYQVTDFYTKSEQDTRYVNATGDTVTGQFNVSYSADNPLRLLKNTGTKWNYIEYFSDAANPTTRTAFIGTDNNGYFTINNSLVIDTSGRVNMPSQPAFRSSITAGFTLSTSLTKFGAGLLTEIFDTTNSFNHTTATFQAPAGGRYMFAIHWAPNTSGRMNTNFYVNGAYAGGGVASANGGSSVSTLVQLATGDTFEVYVQSSTGSTVSVDNSGIYYGYMVG